MKTGSRKAPPSIDVATAVDAISVDNLADATHTSRQLIYDAINGGELPSFLLGRRRMIRLTAWRDFVARREAASALPKERPHWRDGKRRATAVA